MVVRHNLKENTITVVAFEKAFTFDVEEETKLQNPEDYWITIEIDEYFNLRVNIEKYNSKYYASFYPEVYNGEHFTTYFNRWETVNIEII